MEAELAALDTTSAEEELLRELLLDLPVVEKPIPAILIVAVWPPVSSRQDMGRTIKGGPAHKIKACIARLHEDVIYRIIPNMIFSL